MSEAAESLSDILAGHKATPDSPATKSTEAAAGTAAASATPEAKPTDKGPQRDASGKFMKAEGASTEAKPAEAAATEAKPATTPPESAPKPEKRADVAAIMDERRKRQALERELEQLRGQQAKASPSVFEDEDAAISTRVNQATAPLQERLFRQSMRLARMEHGEAFAEAEAAFAEAVERDPRLIDAWRAADDPGEYVYAVGLQIKELADVGGDFVKYREKLTAGHAAALAEKDARIKALETEVAELKKSGTDLAALNDSLNSRASGQAASTATDDEDIDSIVRFGNTRG